MLKKFLIVIIVISVLLVSWQLELFAYLDFLWLKSHLVQLEEMFRQSPVRFILGYFLFYVLVTALSFPGGATLLTMLSGAVMGFWPALLTVSLASTTGATLAFFASRFLFRDLVEKKFRAQVKSAREEVVRNGHYYLLSMRLIPVFPFFLINLVMGITPIKARTFFWASYLGMLPAISVFIFAGKGFATIQSPSEIFSAKFFLLFTLIGFFPLLVKSLVERWRVQKLYRRFKKPTRFDYDTIVIGGGSAGLVSALLTSSLKAKTALIEKGKMGGDCLNTGCIPSKTLIEASRLAVKTGVKPDFSAVMKKVKQTQAEIAPNDSVERFTGLGVDCFEGKAKILSPYEVEINGKNISSRNLIVATGARPRVPGIAGVESVPVLTSDTLWDLQTLPEKLLIIGAGPIGCEMAQAFKRLGSSVVLLEEGKEILPKEDADISSIIEKQFREEGIQLFLYTKAHEFISNDGKFFLKAESLGKELLIEFDSVLMATGRIPNVHGFGLENLGLVLNPNGTIKTNAFMQTNYPNIFACGDVAGPFQLTHMASYQAWLAAVNSLFRTFKKFKSDYRTVSWCTFTEPEVATAGFNEKSLAEKEMDYEVTTFPFSRLDRAVVDGRTTGFVKVLTKKGSDKILGATIAGPEAGLLILEFVSAIKYNKGMKDILNTIHPYPTLGEAGKFAAGEWQKNHTPVFVLQLLEKFFRWQRK